MKQPISRFWSVSLVALILFSVSVLVPDHILGNRVTKQAARFAYGRRVVSSGDVGKAVIAAAPEGDFTLLAGFWMGTIDRYDLRVLYRITPQGIVYNYSLDQGGALIPAGMTTFDDKSGKVAFWFPTIGGTYKAILDDDKASSNNNKMRGKWMQAGQRLDLDMYRYQPPTKESDDVVPREFRFLLQKSVSGDPKKLVQMAGFWSGYAADHKDESAGLVILRLEKITDSLVEPKLLLPEDSPLPYPIHSLQVDSIDGKIKIVVDGNGENGDVNAVLEGQLSGDGKKLTGTLYYDDQDYTPPLELVWSEHLPFDLEKVWKGIE
eukprot:CAMPEP_0119014530 /NCGR_PEP_ID=MMETSP1176-20130426/9897_1 /TAXON_ID=265551 /ORGANISM="Synedropsis recta cf, Strain CCMP1620" /LENGTH=320 /DNA_ID=CAMNT_0006967721 /DNA_START=74 /DNA_END=1036 /DNA_ORIENTATION=+